MTTIITFTGVQGSGKTSMRRQIAHHLIEKGFSVIDQYVGVIDSISRDAVLKGFVLNEETNFETQYYLAIKYIVSDLETRKIAEIDKVDYIILDRSPLDVIPYSTNASNITDHEKSVINNVLLNYFTQNPSILVYCAPLEKIAGDGIRSVDKKFQTAIDARFLHLMAGMRTTTTVIKLQALPLVERVRILISELNL